MSVIHCGNEQLLNKIYQLISHPNHVWIVCHTLKKLKIDLNPRVCD